MAKELKTILYKGLDQSLSGVTGCVLIDIKGINSEQTHELRSSFARQGTEITVVPNRIARRVFGDHGAPKEFQALFKGPTAVIYSTDGAVTASKLIVEWRKKNSKDKDLASIKGGLLQGKTLDAAGVEQLAKLPDTATLQRNVAGLFLGPLSHLASVTQSLVSQFAGCVRAHRETLEKGQGGGGAG